MIDQTILCRMLGDFFHKLAELNPPPPPAAEQPAELNPPPPPAAEQPAELNPPPPPANTDQEVDSSGIPWDERIHARTKAKIADGTWRKKRGIDGTLFNQVMAELKGTIAPPLPPSTPEQTATAPPPPPTSEQTAPPLPPSTPEQTATAPPPPPTSEQTAEMTPEQYFGDVVTPAMMSGTLSYDVIDGINKTHGFANIIDILGRPELFPQIKAVIDEALNE